MFIYLYYLTLFIKVTYDAGRHNSWKDKVDCGDCCKIFQCNDTFWNLERIKELAE